MFNTSNIVKLIEHLEKAPEETFDMHECSTCFMGHIKKALYTGDPGKFDEKTAIELIELSPKFDKPSSRFFHRHYLLFFPPEVIYINRKRYYPWNINVEQAIRVLRGILVYNKVDWTLPFMRTAELDLIPESREHDAFTFESEE